VLLLQAAAQVFVVNNAEQTKIKMLRIIIILLSSSKKTKLSYKQKTNRSFVILD
jgi:hypothetical protein